MLSNHEWAAFDYNGQLKEKCKGCGEWRWPDGRTDAAECTAVGKAKRYRWKDLVILCAQGQEVCNCGWAYVQKSGTCDGCDSNQCRARDHVAQAILSNPMI